jgi:ribose transport system substrate-binding protein
MGAIAAFALVAAACGGSDSPSSPTANAAGTAPSASAPASTADKRLKLGMVLILTNIPFGQSIADGAKASASDNNADIQVTGPTSIDPATAQKQATDLLATGLDGLSVAAFPTEAWPKALKDLKGKLDNTITHNTRQDDTSPVDTYVGVNDAEQARVLAREAIKNAGWNADTTGTILLGQCVPGETGVLADRSRGMKEVFQKELPKVDVVGPLQVNVDPNKNTTDWENQLKAHPNPIGVGGTCDQDGESLYKLKTASKGTYAVFAFETPPNTLKGIQDGTIIADVAVDWWLEGYVATKILADRARGVTVPTGFIDTGYTVIDKSNVADVMASLESEDARRAYYQAKIDDYGSNLAAHAHPLADAAS